MEESISTGENVQHLPSDAASWVVNEVPSNQGSTSVEGELRRAHGVTVGSEFGGHRQHEGAWPSGASTPRPSRTWQMWKRLDEYALRPLFGGGELPYSHYPCFMAVLEYSAMCVTTVLLCGAFQSVRRSSKARRHGTMAGPLSCSPRLR